MQTGELKFSKKAQAHNKNNGGKAEAPAKVKDRSKKLSVSVKSVKAAPHPVKTPATTGGRGAFGKKRDELVRSIAQGGVTNPREILAKLRVEFPEWKASDACALSYIYRGLKAAGVK